MPRQISNRLTVKSIQHQSKPGLHADGGGLYLKVTSTGTRSWIYRYSQDGKQKKLGLGAVRDVSLARAREISSELRSSDDPEAYLKGKDDSMPTFKEAAALVYAERGATWKNTKHRQQWVNSLANHADPIIGDMRIDEIDSLHIMKVLTPIWNDKPETGRRVRIRIKAVMDWAIAHQFREHNPVDATKAALPKQPPQTQHYSSMPYIDLPSFLSEVRSRNELSPSRLALDFLIHTSARTGEVLGVTWDEIQGDVWTIPAKRMKGGAEHRVPLVDRCLEILDLCRRFDSDYVFPGQNWSKHMSNMALARLMLRMKRKQFTVHGFRSSFRDWAAERTNFPREVCEAALAHAVGNKVEAAYRRSDLFEKRRALMDQWGRFLTEERGKVVPLKAGKEV